MSLPQVVRAMLFNTEGKILLVKHSPDAPWVFPGGHVETGESLHDAIERELQEEFGIKGTFFEIDQDEILHHRSKKLHHLTLPVSIYELHYQNKEGKDKSRIEYIFLMETTDDITRIQEDEIAAFGWFDGDDILTMQPNIETYDFMIELLEKIVGEEE